jgi:hypothetical protein
MWYFGTPLFWAMLNMGKGKRQDMGSNTITFYGGFQVMLYKIDVPTTWITHNIFKFPLRRIFLVYFF